MSVMRPEARWNKEIYSLRYVAQHVSEMRIIMGE